MKVLRENLFNRIFRKEKLLKQRKEYERVCQRLQKADEFKKALERCDSLLKMVAIQLDFRLFVPLCPIFLPYMNIHH